MGEIIAFQALAGRKRAKAAGAGEDAQILFFTGVRYVRATPTPTEAEAPRHHDDGLTPGGGSRRRAR
jgi:hypothetical protein